MTGSWSQHLVIAPILLPLVASASMLLLDERLLLKRVVSLATTAALAAVAVLLLRLNFANGGAPQVYLVGNWNAPFGIVLVSDWLSSMMLLLTSILGLSSLTYSLARWDHAGPRFHSLFLLQLMGLNGAFLTGDIFNLFVFFEVLLAASYGLMLHGSGSIRVKAGLHYVSINIAASLLFLIGAGLIYATTGTLNIADLAMRIPQVTGGNVALLQSGLAVLGLAFLLKAGMWPLGFWLPTTYAAAAPPVAALFAILSKVGVYAVLRVYLLLFGGASGWATNFGEEWLLFGGMATMSFGIIGVLAVRTLPRLAGYCLIISSGTVLAVIGAGEGTHLAGALFYLVSSTLGISAFYLLIDLLERPEKLGDRAGSIEAVFDDEDTSPPDDLDGDEVGIVIPATIAILGGGFMFCVLLVAGLPPLSGFIAKFAILNGLLDLDGPVAPTTWMLIVLIVLSGLAITIATTRAGIDLIWTPSEKPQPALRITEAAPIGGLLVLCLGLAVFAGPAMRYMERTGQSLQDRGEYVRAVLDETAGGRGEPVP